MKTILFFVILALIIPFISGDNAPQITFHVDIAGSFLADQTSCPSCTPCPSSVCSFNGPTTVTVADCNGNYGPFNDESQQVWGTCANGYTCSCISSSGIGVEGFKNTTMVSNSNISTEIARITHYNNPITISAPKQPRVLQLTFTLNSAQFPNGNSFVVAFLLDFFETPNSGTCDYAIQTYSTPCDDIFWFGSTTTSASFTLGKAKYTLVVDGFKTSATGGAAVPRFITQEQNVNEAFVFARLVTICDELVCPPGSTFIGFPTCACSCSLTETDCTQLFGDGWALDFTACSCYCAANTSAEQQKICESEFPGSNNTYSFNSDRCGCDCNLTNAYCETINPLFGVAPAPQPCACICNQNLFEQCLLYQGRFYQPAGNSCACVCAVSDSLCVETFGQGYTAKLDQCGCVPPGGDGLSGGQIAGIVIGSVAGALLLILLVAALFGLLIFLILKGVIPGIYGYKIEAGDFSATSVSPLYKDNWSTANVVGSD